MSVTVLHADSRDALKGMPDASLDACVTDPPYALVSIAKRFGGEKAAPAKDRDGLYKRASAGFMGKQWDTGDTAFDPTFWVEVLRILKPGAHLIAFGGTRTYHRLVCAIEDAGFEIRDTISWNFGSGFPKSHDPKKGAGEAVCRCPSGEGELCGVRDGSHDALRLVQADEAPDMLAAMQRRSAGGRLEAARAQGTESADAGELCERGDARGEEPCLAGRSNAQATTRELQGRALRACAEMGQADGAGGRLHHGASARDGADVRFPADADGSGQPHRPQPVEQSSDELGAMAGQPEPQEGGAWPLCGGCGKPILPDGLGSALKPAMELIVLARKPLIGTIAANVLKHGTGALNVDACRIEGTKLLRVPMESAKRNNPILRTKSTTGGSETTDVGRWPANVLHDGSEEVLAHFPESDGQQGDLNATGRERPTKHAFGDMAPPLTHAARGDVGSAARFFYTAKADADDRLGSKHPTVKPVDLMAYLVKLVTPPGGVVLDPFAGSGTTGMACMREGFDAVLIERELEYYQDILRRLDHVKGADTPLFAEVSA